jgi:chromosomal replication initiation ATPase DnaA
MTTAGDGAVLHTIQAGRPDDRRLAGDDDFVRQITHATPRTRLPGVTIEDIIGTACEVMQHTAEEITGPGRTRVLASARAVIAAVNAELDVAQQAAVARRLGRSEASICRRRQRLSARERTVVDQVCEMLKANTGTDLEGDAERATQHKTEQERESKEQP